MNEKKIKVFNKETLIYRLLILISIFVFAFLIDKIVRNANELETFRTVSKKPFKVVSNKEEALKNAYGEMEKASLANDILSPTNLNIAKIYDIVKDDEEINFYKNNSPVPVTIDSIIEETESEEEEETEEVKTSAFQIYEKMQRRYEALRQSLYNMVGMKPVNIVRQYQYNGFSIIGKYNPEDPSHVVGKRHTWFIPNFQNVNIYYEDGDGNPIDTDNNIQDIMSMASIYTYYRNPYDVNTFLKYCYNLFDHSYSCIASVSEVYYCSGCMHYDDPNVATGSDVSYEISLDKIKSNTKMQKVLPKDIPHKAGTLKRMDDSDYTLIGGDYSSYVDNIYKGNNNDDELNYCPGHIDLNLFVKILTLDATNSLFSIDNAYGNRGYNYTMNWHGWDAFKKNEARILSYKDWEKEYGLGVSYIEFIEPLTQEEINYYLSRLDKNLSPNRVKVIETALRSIGKIPYYYGGKTHRFGYEGNNFGTKIPADYKGRCLKGLDCSGWVNWVYGTAFNKYIIKSEGTNKLAGEGTKILRSDLLPGDIIVRPGIDSHVMMFYEWAPDGRMTVIHENGGVNNVSIGTFDAYYPYYRRILNS